MSGNKTGVGDGAVATGAGGESRAGIGLETIGKTLGSHQVAIFEALVAARRRGLTIPDIVKTSGVPNSTAHRIIQQFERDELIYAMKKKGKAPVYVLNSNHVGVVEIARAILFYARRTAAIKAGLPAPETRLVGEQAEPVLASFVLHERKKGNERKPAEISFNKEALL